MAGLRQLDGGDEHPQERVVVLASNLDRPVVEVVQGAPTVVHVIEPVAVNGVRFPLDELTDVDWTDAESGVAYALRRSADGQPWSPVPTVDAEGLVLRVELARPNGVATLGPDGVLLAAQRPAPPAPPPQEFRHTQLVIASLWQIRHDLGFDPAGVYVEDSDGNWVEPERVTYPIPGEVLEIRFGLPTYGTARLS